MQEFRDISYTDPPRDGHYTQFDLYVPSGGTRPASSNALLCFFHGGGWTKGDKSEFPDFARRVASSVPCTVAIVNYRLTTPGSNLAHPAHASDVLQFLEFAKEWDGPQGKPVYNGAEIYAVGHSCGSHLLTSILLKPHPECSADLSVLTPSPRLLSSVRGVVCSGSAFNITRILEESPHYKEPIVIPGFGDLPSYADFDVTKYGLYEGGENTRWLLIYAQGDQVVTQAQSEEMATRLKHLVKAAGKAEDQVQTNFKIQATHNGVLEEEGYLQALKSFVIGGSNA